ncbi:class I SAM-dependent methyltransferase [Candidatus Marsarchaeota archaeon]|jgi:ubiquinone/menaquinone biosynthesis C-methylase UbiE|nr:class I SAM-dependent methyltransferase [Candidatus Marsarchaeota archaeon]
MDLGLALKGYLFSPRRKVSENPAELIPPKLISGLVVADLGCGGGFYTKYLAEYAAKVYAIDSSKETLRLASSEIQSKYVEFINADITDTHLKTESIDVVLMANVFHDVKSKNAVDEVERILKATGTLIIIDWKKEKTTVGPPYELRITADECKSYFYGFRTIRITDASEYQYEIIMEKGDGPAKS